FAARMQEVFERYDVLLAPATPVPATVLGDEWFDLGGRRLPLRASMGLFTQPISFVGLPVVAVPVETGDPLPIGVQVIAAPWREDLALRVAAHLERIGAVRARVVP
ncbi:MAG: AtzE family amidohydrolase, partial [Burkholderiales bacterium]|nr:AtzE family amidohydrolase [Burkholderiales bacterium]